MQVFAHTYPGEVAGLVLVDPEDGRLITRLRAVLPAKVWAAREQVLAVDALPAPVKREYDALGLTGDETARATPLPAVPVVLFTGTKKDAGFPGNPSEQDLKLAMHNELAAQTPGVRHVLVPSSRHYIQNDAPELVVTAIAGILTQVRHNRR